MKPAPFAYQAVATLQEALAALKAHGDEARIVAGGQSLAPMMNMRLAQPGFLVDINRVRELASIEEDQNSLVIGALVRHHELSRHELVRTRCPILAEAAGMIGSYAIRQRGTLGGSLVQADPAAQLPLVTTLLDAEMELTSETGRRLVRAADFFVSVFTTAIRNDEILTAVRVPKLVAREGWGFAMFAAVAGDYAIASAAATVLRDPDGRISRLRLAVGSLGPTPLRLENSNAVAKEPSPEWVRSYTAAVADGLDIEDTSTISAQYRRELAAVMIEDALALAAKRSE